MPATLSYELAKLITMIPGYDPYATAAPGEWFDEEAAQIAIDFIEQCCTLSQGQGRGWRAGQPFKLEPWQKAIIACLFGWKRADGTRRYRECLVFVPRKNGKSELAAAIICLALFCTAIEDEPGAQIYSAAGKRDQTKYVFQPVKKMIVAEPELKSRSQIYQRSIVVGDKSYQTIAAEATTEHGGRTQLAIVDELHAQATRELVDVLKTSMAGSLQPMMIHLTTSDYEREGSICNATHKYACQVRDNGGDPERAGYDSSFLPVIYEASRDADWTDPEVWKAANPNYGITVGEEYLQNACKRAQDEPEFENEFKRLHLNIRTEQAFRWMPMAKWDACTDPVDPQALLGQDCWAGLDLASVEDMAALVLCFRVGDKYHLLPYFWCPEETAERRERKERQPYVTWARQKLIELTPGNRIDYRYIRKRVNELGKLYKIREVAFDPWNATTLAQQLADEDGFTMAEFRQGTISMNEPMKSMMGLVLGRELCHGGHPVLRWNASNIAARRDASDNVRPDKEKSSEKIDGMVAAIMALARAMANGGEGASVYDTRGALEY